MKANRAFKSEDEAVSPVIAVILMVAITVVLAATVYVWVSGFGQSGSQAKNLSVTVHKCTDTSGAAPITALEFSVVSVSPNFGYSSLKIKDATAGTDFGVTSPASGTIGAGDKIVTNTFAGTKCTDTVNFVDTAANTVVSTITLFAKA